MRCSFLISRACGLSLTAVLTFALLVATPASADDATSPLAVRLTAEGAAQTGTVPDGMCSAVIRVVGGGGGANWAHGGSRDTQTGGHAADLTIRIGVDAGQTFAGTVGGGGSGNNDGSANPGGAGGGGAGGAGSHHTGAGGGGRTTFVLDDTLVVVAGGGGGSGSGHWADGMHGGDAGVPSDIGLVAPGVDGGAGRDVISGYVSTPGGEAGQAERDGSGAVHDGDNERSGHDGLSGQGGRGGRDTSYDGGGGGGAGFTGGGGGVATLRNGGGRPSSGAAAIGGSGGGGGSSFILGTGLDHAATIPTLLSASSATSVGAGAIRVGSGNVGLLEVTFEHCPIEHETENIDVAPADGTAVADELAPEQVIHERLAAIVEYESVLDGPTRNDDGSYSLTYEVLLRNEGEARSEPIDLPIDLSTRLGQPVEAIVVENTCSGNRLGIGAECRIELYGRIVPQFSGHRSSD